jgi:aminopeptidase N
MARRPALVFAVLILTPLTPSLAQGQRPVDAIGAYVPPRTWPQRARVFDLLHQRIEVSYDLDQRTVRGEVLTRLVVTAAPTDTIRLDASNLTIDAARDARGRRLRLAADTSGVTVRLPRRASVGDTVVFSLTYHGRPERGMYFVPRRRIMWTQGEAIETPGWVPTYNAPNDKTTWEILVTTDSGMSAVSNGRLVEVTPAPGGKRVWHWSEDLPASTYLYSIVAGPLTVLHDTWRGVPVDYWVSPDTVDATWRTFGETPSMIEIYSRVLGVNFPWAKYAQAIIPDFTYGGMENVSATTQTDLALHGIGGEPGSSGRGLNAHELAHQWFGDLTTTASWAHAWLNEGLTTYMESVHEEHSRGWEAAEWNWLNQQRSAMNADRNIERPLVFGNAAPGTDPIQLFFSGHVYRKGAQVAHQLRRLLGDSTFWTGMRRFLTDNAYRPVETADFAVAMERASGRDLDWFFDQWAYGIGYPRVHVTRAWDDAASTLTLTVSQTQPIDSTHPLFRFPATVRVVTRDSVVRRDIFVAEQDQRFVLPLPEAPLTIRFDEGGWLLGTVTTDQTPAELAELARHDLEFRARYWALRQLDSSTADVARDARRFIALNDESPHMRAEALRQLARDSSAESRALVRAGLADPDEGVRERAVLSVAQLEGAAAVQDDVVDLIRHDRSFGVQSTALGVYDPNLAREGTALLVDRVRNGGSLTVQATAASRLVLHPDSAGTAAIEALTLPVEPRGARQHALTLLGRLPDKSRAVAVATRYLGDGDQLFAVSAVQMLGRVGGTEARAALQTAREHETRVTVRAAMDRVLERR